MRQNKNLIFLVAICFVASLAVVSNCESSIEITGQLKSTIDKVINIVTDAKLKNNEEARRIALQKTIDQRFNYQQMVRRSLAKNWAPRSNEERKNFIKLFKTLLENSYASKLEAYSDEKIEYIEEIVKGQYAQVKTKVIRPSSTIAVDYNLINENGSWKVYDFVIEGVSMIRNYKSQFTKIIRKDSYEVLVQKLTEKVNALENQKNAPEKL